MADEDVPEVVDAAIDAGITLFDTADVYGNRGGSETLLGRALGSRRPEVIIATKFGGDMQGGNGPDWGARGSRRYIRLAVEASLRRLGTDWIDLYQLHTPDPNTPIEETLAALTSWSPRARSATSAPPTSPAGRSSTPTGPPARSGYEAFISAQNEYSWLNRGAEAELVPALEHTGQSLLPYFPLARGLLTGKYRRGESAPAGTRLAKQERRARDRADFDTVEALQAFAAERGLTMLQVAIGGLARDADRRLGDRRRDLGRAGSAERDRRPGCGRRAPLTTPDDVARTLTELASRAP